MLQVEVFWVVTLGSVVLGYRRFGGPAASIFRASELRIWWRV